MSDRNEWFKDVKRLMQGLEVETVENPFAWPTVTSVTDGEDVLHALGLHPSRDVCGIVNVDIDEVHELIRHIEPEPVTGSTRAYNVVSGTCKTCHGTCGKLCQVRALHGICHRIHSLLAGDGE